MVLAQRDFRDSEYIVPKAFLEKKDIIVNSVSFHDISVGRFGYEVKNDFNFETYSDELKEFDGICFIGGIGSLDFMDNSLVQDLTKYYFKNNKVVGAICAASSLLLHWGILDGKNCTGSNYDGSFSKLCSDSKANYLNKSCVVDGKVITAEGPRSSEEFALEIIKLLQ